MSLLTRNNEGGGTGRLISLLPSFWGNFFLLPKLGLKIGSGQHTTPALSCKGSIMTFRALPLHQLTTRIGPNHSMYAYKEFCGGKAHIPVPKVTSLYKTYRHVPPQRIGFFALFRSENGYRFCPFWSRIGCYF